MFVVSERNIVIPGPNGQKFHMPRKYMGQIPKWVEESPYFKALVKDKKVIFSESGRDKDVDAALKGRRRNRKRGGKKEPELTAPGTDQEETPDDSPEPEEEAEDPDVEL